MRPSWTSIGRGTPKTTLELFWEALLVAFFAWIVCSRNASSLWEWQCVEGGNDAVRFIAFLHARLLRLHGYALISNQLCKKSVGVLRFHLQQNDVQRESGGNKNPKGCLRNWILNGKIVFK